MLDLFQPMQSIESRKEDPPPSVFTSVVPWFLRITSVALVFIIGSASISHSHDDERDANDNDEITPMTVMAIVSMMLTTRMRQVKLAGV